MNILLTCTPACSHLRWISLLCGVWTGTLQGMGTSVLGRSELDRGIEGDVFDEPYPVVADVKGVRLVLRARHLRGRMTLVEAAHRAGLNRDELSRLERGETTQVRFSTIAKLLAAYGCTLTDLVAVERVPTRTPLYAGALAALEAGVLASRGPDHRAVRRSTELDVIPDGEESTFVSAAETTPRWQRSAVGTVHP